MSGQQTASGDPEHQQEPKKLIHVVIDQQPLKQNKCRCCERVALQTLGWISLVLLGTCFVFAILQMLPHWVLFAAPALLFAVAAQMSIFFRPFLRQDYRAIQQFWERKIFVTIDILASIIIASALYTVVNSDKSLSVMLTNTDIIFGYKLVNEDSSLSDTDALNYLTECSQWPHQIPNHFERPEFEQRLQDFINSTHCGLIMGANKIGKSVALQYFCKKKPYCIYFDLSLYSSVMKFNKNIPCSILSSLDLGFLRQTALVRLKQDLAKKFDNTTLPILIFDQTDKLLQNQFQRNFLNQLIDQLGAPADNNKQFRIFFVGSEGHVLKDHFASGTISPRVKKIYVSGFNEKETCMLWILNILGNQAHKHNHKLFHYYREICSLWNSTTQEVVESLHVLDSSINATDVGLKLELFREIYSIAGDYFSAMGSDLITTESNVLKQYTGALQNKMPIHFTQDPNSSSFLQKMVNKTKSSAFNKVSAKEFERRETKSAGAKSNLVRIQEVDKRVTYSFRIPYYRGEVKREFKGIGIDLE